MIVYYTRTCSYTFHPLVCIMLLSLFLSSRAIQPSLLMKKLFEYDSTLSSIVIATVGRSLDLLVEGYPLLVQESLLGMVQRIVDTSNSRGNIASLKLLTQLTVQSPPILQLVAEEALSVCTLIYMYMYSMYSV